ncbi:asparaginase [Candidatus Woesearchaeota archaeon]|nr:asparaginase [Candidatus Woesearchaeota archaeon]
MKKKIAVITTGGTIAGVSINSTSYGSPYKVKLSGEQVLNKFPNLEDIANIELYELGIIDSSQMVPNDWSRIAETIFPYLLREDIAGVVLTHGTDTLEYTSMALALMLKNLNKPVVITGAMHTIDQDENHVRKHLEDSIRTAISEEIKDVVVCFSADEHSTYTNLYRATSTFKYSSWANNAFQSHLENPIGEIKNKQLSLKNYRVRIKNKKPILKSKYSNNIDVITLLGPEELTDFNIRNEGYLLNIIGGIGRKEKRYNFVKSILSSKIPVAITSDYQYNLKLTETEKDKELEQMGAIPLGRMYWTKAYVKLAWAIGQARGDNHEIKRLMLTNLNGEMNKRFYKTFL